MEYHLIYCNADNDFVNDEGYDHWPFMSVHHGVRIHTGSICLYSQGDYVKMSNLSMTLYGTEKTQKAEAIKNTPNRCN